MIVSCESCKSRYKLDDSKITGRGAKITCPKCKHVFVVLAPPPTMTDTPRPAMLPQQGETNEWEDDEPTRVGREAAEAAAAAVAGPAVPREHEVVRPRAGAPPPPPPPSKEAIAARAAKLDFRKVGINAWKVKVRIGLVYDFSDIKTLRKYIQDGRVTAADVISHDGKNWKPLGEIPDLDSFFLESYERLEVEYAAKAPAAKESGPSPADLGNVAAALAAAAAAELEEGGEPRATGPVYEDPFEAMKQRQRERAGKKPPPKVVKPQANNTPMLLVSLVLLAVGAGGLWWTFGRAPPTPDPAPVTPVPPVAKAPTPPGPEIWRPVPPDSPGSVDPVAPPAPLPGDCPDGYVWNINLQACMQAGPRGAGPAVQTPGTGNVAPVAPSPGSSSVSESDDEAIGDEAMKKKDYETAVVAYGKAGVALKLGEAQMRAGDQAGAMATLTQASSSNKKAFKLIGELQESAGDLAGARAAFQKYVAAFPKDTAVKAHLEALGP